MRGSIEGQIVAVDPGQGARAPGSDDIVFAIASALSEELARVGAKPAVLRERDDDPSTSERARRANELGAAVCLSIHLASGDRSAGAPTCSYFGTDRTHSPAGMRLAGLLLQELEAELGRRGRLQRLAPAMLRETRMTAVLVEPLVEPDEGEAAPTDDSAGAERIGRALAAGVRRYFRDIGAAPVAEG
jgi:N-acetylmuramoyl-L-alanine amidase